MIAPPVPLKADYGVIRAAAVGARQPEVPVPHILVLTARLFPARILALLQALLLLSPRQPRLLFIRLPGPLLKVNA